MTASKFPVLEAISERNAIAATQAPLERASFDYEASGQKEIESAPRFNLEGTTAPIGYGLESMPEPAVPWGKCTPEMTARMVESVRAGNFPDTAAVACGLSLRSYWIWRQKGQAGEEPYATWLAAMARACAESEIELVRRIAGGDDRGAGFGPAKAALELLGRRNPKRWSQQVRVEVADQLTRFIDIAEEVCGQEIFTKLLERLAEADSETE